MHVHFLIPCYGGQISEATFTSFVRFVAKAQLWELEWSLDTIVNESLIPRGRNALVARALANTRATHLLFLDADIGFDPESVLMLLEEDVDVIGGGYPKKSLPVDYVINPLPGGITDSNKAEVERIGTGFLLIKRHVFEHMAAKMPELKYLDDCGLGPSLNENLFAFFECGLFGHKVFMSEDWLFCNRWRALGGRIFISKRFALTHVGSYSFSEASQAALFARLSSQVPFQLATADTLAASEAAIATELPVQDLPVPEEVLDLKASASRRRRRRKSDETASPMNSESGADSV